MKYYPTVHAVEQAGLRFGITPENVTNWVNQCITAGAFVTRTTQRNGNACDVYEHKGKRFVVGSNNAVVSVIPAAIDSEITTKVKDYVIRQYRKAQREHKRQARALNIRKAELGLEHAQLALNHAKTRSPKTQAAIQVKLDEISAQMGAIDLELKRAADWLENERRSAEIYGVKL